MFLQMFTLICVLITLQVVYYQIKIKLNLTMINNINEKLFSGTMSGLMAVVLSFYIIDNRFDVFIGLGVTCLIIGLIYSGSLTFSIGYIIYGIWLYVFPYIETMYSLQTYILIGMVLVTVNFFVKSCKVYVKGITSVMTYAFMSGLFAYFISNDVSFTIRFVLSYLILATISVFVGVVIISYMQNYVKMYEKMETEAMHDALTGLLNRRHFNQCISELKPDSPVSMLMMDIDYFKNINDTYGHSAGDMVLKMIADTIKRVITEKRSIARIGGEEFAVILRNRSLDEAKIIAEKLRLAIEETDIHCEEIEGTINVTVSIGIASYPSETKSIPKLYDAADERLYFAKKLGRNQIQYSTPKEIISKLK